MKNNMEKEGLYRFCWPQIGSADIEGVFISTQSEVESIIGRDVYFGEISGKHSEVYGTIEEGEITLLTDNEEAVAVVKKYRLYSGFNPFDYLPESDKEE